MALSSDLVDFLSDVSLINFRTLLSSPLASFAQSQSLKLDESDESPFEILDEIDERQREFETPT